MKKVIFTIILILSLALSGCYNGVETLPVESNITASVPAESNLLKELNSAKEIQITEAFISLGKEYGIFVDGIQVGTVTGEFIHLTGDTFTMTDMNGTVVASESQIKRWNVKMNRQAVFMDNKGEITGYISEDVIDDFFNPGFVFHFYNKDQQEIGISDQIFWSMLKENTMRDNSSNELYYVEQQFGFTDDYVMQVKDNSVVPVEMAVFMVCIEDAIKDAKEN